MEPKIREFAITDEKALGQFARNLRSQIEPGMVIGLTGDLGAGKTTFVYKFVDSLLKKNQSSGGEQSPVHSPTFGLIHEYPSEPRVIHMDLYRLAEKTGAGQKVWEELEAIGFRDYLDGSFIIFIEWFDLLPPLACPVNLCLDFQFDEHNTGARLIKIYHA
jgi:tRNA threonylcarbamoyladenosine biosynthesis protein TsaE